MLFQASPSHAGLACAASHAMPCAAPTDRCLYGGQEGLNFVVCAQILAQRWKRLFANNCCGAGRVSGPCQLSVVSFRIRKTYPYSYISPLGKFLRGVGNFFQEVPHIYLFYLLEKPLSSPNISFPNKKLSYKNNK